MTLYRPLWPGILGGPAAWALAAGAGYVFVSRACAAGRPTLAATGVSALAGAALLVAIGCTIFSYRRWHGVREHRRFVAGARADDVGSYLAWAGTVTSALSALGSALVLLAPFLVSPCVKAW
jgi:hypothetical protein